MKIISITNSANYKMPNNKLAVANSKNYASNTEFTPAFGGSLPFKEVGEGGLSIISRIFGFERKVAKPVSEPVSYNVLTIPGIGSQLKQSAELPKITAATVMDKLSSLWINDPFHSDDSYLRHLVRIKKNLYEDTVPFANTLVDRMNPKVGASELTIDAEAVANLVEVYNKNYNARPVLQKAVDDKVKGKPRFSLFALGDSPYGMFSCYQKWSNLKSKYALKMLNAKALNGGPRFCDDAVKYTIKNVNAVNAPALDLLLKQQIKGQDTISNKKLAKVISGTTSDSFEQDKRQAIISGKKEYLLNASGCGLKEFLQSFTSPEQFPILKAVLPKATEVSQVTRALIHYSPDKQAYFEKGLALVEEGKLSMGRFVETLKYAPKDKH